MRGGKAFRTCTLGKFMILFTTDIEADGAIVSKINPEAWPCGTLINNQYWRGFMKDSQ